MIPVTLNVMFAELLCSCLEPGNNGFGNSRGKAGPWGEGLGVVRRAGREGEQCWAVLLGSCSAAGPGGAGREKTWVLGEALGQL